VGQIGRLKQARHSVSAARQKCGIVGATRKETLDACANVRFANAAATLSVAKMGAQPSAPKRKEIEVVLKAAS
jgi:ribokinase